MANLPFSDPELITLTRDEFENTRGKVDYPDAAFRYAWALVHSRRREDVALGKQICEELLERVRRQLILAAGTSNASSAAPPPPQPPSGPSDRELTFTLAVAHYRLKEFVDARRVLKALLDKYPESAQARNLLQDVEDSLIKDGLVTAGVVGGALVVGGIVLGAILGGGGKGSRR